MDPVTFIISTMALLTAIAFIYISSHVKQAKHKFKFICCIFIFVAIGSVPFAGQFTGNSTGSGTSLVTLSPLSSPQVR